MMEEERTEEEASFQSVGGSHCTNRRANAPAHSSNTTTTATATLRSPDGKHNTHTPTSTT
jgi:hypothetical protein